MMDIFSIPILIVLTMTLKAKTTTVRATICLAVESVLVFTDTLLTKTTVVTSYSRNYENSKKVPVRSYSYSCWRKYQCHDYSFGPCSHNFSL